MVLQLYIYWKLQFTCPLLKLWELSLTLSYCPSLPNCILSQWLGSFMRSNWHRHDCDIIVVSQKDSSSPVLDIIISWNPVIRTITIIDFLIYQTVIYYSPIYRSSLVVFLLKLYSCKGLREFWCRLCIVLYILCDVLDVLDSVGPTALPPSSVSKRLFTWGE